MKHAHARFLRFIEGADGAAGGAPAPAPTPTPDPTPDPDPAPTPTIESLTADRDRLSAEVATLRHEAAASRVNAKQSAAADALAPIVQALGLDSGVDAAALLAAVTTARDGAAQTRASRIEADLVTQAVAAGLDVAALRDSRAIATKLAALDPGADGYADALAQVLTEAAGDPRFKSSATRGPTAR
jgi:hypothetical protein